MVFIPSAVLGVVLIQVDGGEAAASDVADVPRAGDIRDVGVRHGAGHDKFDWGRGALDGRAHAGSDGGCGECGDRRSMATGAGGGVLGVGIWGRPAAHIVDAEVVVVHVDAEEAALAPVSAP